MKRIISLMATLLLFALIVIPAFAEGEETSVTVSVSASDAANATLAKFDMAEVISGALAAAEEKESGSSVTSISVGVTATATSSGASAVTYEVHPEAVVTIDKGGSTDTTSFTVANDDLAADASFTFDLDVTALGLAVGGKASVTHTSAGYPDEVVLAAVEGDSTEQHVTVTASHFSTFTVESTTTVVDGFYNSGDSYFITSLAGLRYFSDQVNAGTDYAGKTVSLEADIDMSSVADWAPIGDGVRAARATSFYSGNAFKGVFEGNGHTVTGLTITSAPASETKCGKGLFGLVAGSGAAVRNFTLANVNIALGSQSTVDGGIGAACGIIADGATVSGVTVSSGAIAGNEGVGGIVGKVMAYGTISGCTNNASVSATSGAMKNVGGIVGAAYYTRTDGDMFITDCANTGSVSNQSTTNGGVGGIAGLSAAKVSGCTNSGNVTAGRASIGGIVGEQQAYGFVKNCVNSGDVTNTGTGEGTGGIVGWIRYNNSASDYPQSGVIEVSGCSNSGDVTTSGTHVGGLVGDVYNYATLADNTNTASSVSAASGNGAGFIGAYNPSMSGNNYAVLAASVGAAEATLTDNVSTTIDITAPSVYMAVGCDSGYVAKLAMSGNSVPVAKIGTTGYDTLAAALADAQSGDTVTLLDDVSLATSVTNEAGGVTLDLNGKTITASGFANKVNAIVNTGALTVTNGTIVVADTDSKVYAILNDGGSLTATGLTIASSSGGIRVAGGTGVIENCAITVSTTQTTYAHGVYASDGANVTVNSGTYSYTGPVSQDTVQACEADTVMTINGGTFAAALDSGSTQNATPKVLNNNGSGAVVYVKGGSFSGDLGANNGYVHISGGTFALNGIFSNMAVISGGTFNSNPSTWSGATIAAGYAAVETETSGIYAIQVEEGKVARNVTQNIAYSALAGALLAAEDGDTIEILDGTWGADAIAFDSLTLSEKLTIRTKSLTVQAAEGATPKFVADVFLGYDDSKTVNASMTVRGLAFENAKLSIGEYVQVTVENCSFTGSGANAALAIIDSCVNKHLTDDEYPVSQVTVTGCTFNGTATDAPAIRIRNSGNVTITGNTVANSSHNGILLESNGDVNSTVAKTVIIEDNEITEWNASNVPESGRGVRLALGTLAEGSTVTVEGNTFRKEQVGLDEPDFVKISGAGAGTVDISGNDWNDMLLSEVKGNSAIYSSDSASAPVIDSVITTKKEPVAQIVTNEGATTNKYESLREAYEAASDGATIELIADDRVSLTTETPYLRIAKTVTITGPLDENGDPIYGIYGMAGYVSTGFANEHCLLITGGAHDITISNLKIEEFGNLASTCMYTVPIWTGGGLTGVLTLDNVRISKFNRGAVTLQGGGFVITNCYIDCEKSLDYSPVFVQGVEIDNNATGTIVDTTITNVFSNNSGWMDVYAVQQSGHGVADVVNCNLSGQGGVSIGGYVGTGAGTSSTLNVSDCVINATRQAIYHDPASPITMAAINVYSGSYNGPIEKADDVPGIYVSGGMFSVDPSVYVVPGYAAVAIAEGSADYNAGYRYTVGKVETQSLTPTVETPTEATYNATVIVTNGTEVLETVTDQTISVAVDKDRSVDSSITLSDFNMPKVVSTAVSAAGTSSDNVTVDLLVSAKTNDVDAVEKTVTFEVHPEAIVTVGEGATASVTTNELTNADLASNALFSFRLYTGDAFAVDTQVRVVHRSADSNYEDESFLATVASDTKGRYVQITTTHFSEFEISAITPETGKVAVNLTTGTQYGTLADAVAAEAASGATIALLDDVTETVTIGKSLVLDGNGHSVTGNITADDGATVGIVGGKFNGTLDNTGTGDFEISGGVFSNLPAAGYQADGFYNVVNTDAGTSSTYQYTVGDKVRCATGGESVGVVVPLVWVAGNTTGLISGNNAIDLDTLASDLAANGANGVKVWQSYVLGLDPNTATSQVRIESAVAAEDTTKVKITGVALSMPNLASQGTTVAIRLQEKTAAGSSWAFRSETCNFEGGKPTFTVPASEVSGKVLRIVADIVTTSK